MVDAINKFGKLIRTVSTPRVMLERYTIIEMGCKLEFKTCL